MSADPRLARPDLKSMAMERFGYLVAAPNAFVRSVTFSELNAAMQAAYDLGVEQERARCLALVEELAGYTAPANLIAAIRAAASEVPPHP